MTFTVVLAGGGHTNCQVVMQLTSARVHHIAGAQDVRLVLVSDAATAFYSGMMPGVVAGLYPEELAQVDLARLCERHGWEFIEGRVVGICAADRWLEYESGHAASQRVRLTYTLLAIDVGSTVRPVEVDLGPAVAAGKLVATRPISLLNARVAACLKASGKHGDDGDGSRLHVVVVGGGAAGVELAFSLKHRLQRAATAAHVTIVDAHATLLPTGYAGSTVRRVQEEAERQGLTVLCGRQLAAVSADTVRLDDGTVLPYSMFLLATGAAAHDFLRRGTDLAVDRRGFVRVRATLQAAAHDDVFACGDCASMDDFDGQFPPKAGVYAVRHGPILARNLEALLRVRLGGGGDGTELLSYVPQREFLSLLTLGDGRAIGSKLGFTFAGRWVWRMKDHIDRHWMRQFPHPCSHHGDEKADDDAAAKAPAAPAPAAPSPAALPDVSALDASAVAMLLAQPEDHEQYEAQLAVMHRLHEDPALRSALEAHHDDTTNLKN